MNDLGFHDTSLSPHEPLRGSVPLQPAWRCEVPAAWNRTEQYFPRDKCLHQLFEEQVAVAPQAVAIAWREQVVTYEELNRRANCMAYHLLDRGIRPETTVAVCLHRSPDLIAAILGVLKAGGAYVPLDPHYPAARLAFMLDDSRADWIVVDGQVAGGSHKFTRQTLRIDSIRDQGRAGDPPHVAGPHNLAYVIYTSGSTGTPKGVAIEHRNAAAFLHWVREAFSPSELSGVLASSSICFDLSLFEIFGPLAWGGQIILAENAVHDEIGPAWDQIRLINTVPSVMQNLLQYRSAPRELTTVNLAGELLKPSLVDAVYRQWHVQRVNDLYGPSETTTYSTWITRRPGGPATIGRPIANTQIHVLDADLRPVPIGVAGEIHIGGAGVARGYLHQPTLTAEKFIRHPLSTQPRTRLYRTGDQGRWNADGTLTYLGRNDHQVKIRGHRIELGEVESTLEYHPDVTAAVVIPRSINEHDHELVAFVIPKSTGRCCGKELRAWLSEQLPPHLIPAKIAYRDEFPLTPNGKVDREVLKIEPATASLPETASTTPRTELEETLCGIWRDALKHATVGLDDNFFELGGDSLLAVQLISRIHRATGILVPQRQLAAHTTIRQLAAVLENHRASPAARGTQRTLSQPGEPTRFLLGWLVDSDDLELTDSPCHVVPFPEFDLSVSGCRVESLATRCLETLRDIQPHGPYILIGYSLAGAVAYEMARRLREDHEDVPLVAIIDTAPVTWPFRMVTQLSKWTGHALRLSFARQLLLARGGYYLLERLEQLRQRGWRRATQSLLRDVRSVHARWHCQRQAHLQTLPCDTTPEVAPTRTPRHRAISPFGRFWAHLWAISCFQPLPYDGRVAVFVSDELAAEHPQYGRGWARTAPHVEELRIGGSHGTCVRAEKRELIAQLHRCLHTDPRTA